MDLNKLLIPLLVFRSIFGKISKNSKSVFRIFRSILPISRQYRRHFPNQREILYILVMSKNRKNAKTVFCIFRSILLISRQYRRHFHNHREILYILVMSNLNFDKNSKNHIFCVILPLFIDTKIYMQIYISIPNVLRRPKYKLSKRY